MNLGVGMSDVKTSIRLHLDTALVAGQAIDCDAEAKKLANDFPDYSSEQLARLIFEVVVQAGGNASWGKKG